jgi:ribonuclease HII
MTGHRRPQRVMRPSTRVEREHWQAGRTVIVGADAVGVASLSGPVVAAAVAWPPYARRVPGVRDSKMLSRAQRERLFPDIRRRALAVGIGAASVAEIDRINIYHATGGGGGG